MFRFAIRMIACCVLAACLSAPIGAQELRGVARLAPEGVRVTTDGDGVHLSMGLTQAVPYRIETRLDPMRLIVEFREVDTGRAQTPENVRLVGRYGELALENGLFRVELREHA